MAHHRAGNLDAAERGYREILRVDPAHADALHLMGAAAVQRGEPHQAIDWFQRAIEHAEPSALLLNNLGTALRDTGRLKDAIEAFRRASTIAPEFAGARWNLAMGLEAIGNIDEAIHEYRAAIANDPQFAEAYLRLGCLLKARGDSESALTLLARADTLNPKTVDVLWPLAQAQFAAGRSSGCEATLRKLLRLEPTHVEARRLFADVAPSDDDVNGTEGRPALFRSNSDNIAQLLASAREMERSARWDDAVAAYRRILAIDSSQNEARTALGRHALEVGDAEEARRQFEQIAAVNPDHLEARLQLAHLLEDAGDIPGAIEHARRATAIAPDSAIAWFELGNLIKECGRFDESAKCYRTAVDRDSQCLEAVHNLGIVCRSLGRIDESIGCFEKLVQIDHANAQAHLQLALTRLTQGDFPDGWDEYEWRWQAEAHRRQFSVPEWNGATVRRGTVLVSAEQGIGDQIQFASCLSDVIARSERCLLECERRLVPLFQRSFPGCEVVPQPYSDGSAVDCEIPAGSLPRLFRRRLADFPVESGYLRPAAEKITRWRERFDAPHRRMVVGISWRGGSRPGDVRSRSTELDDWKSILSTPGVRFVNLQYGDVSAELRALQETNGLTVDDWDDADPMVDLDDFAAQIAAVDLVMTVDNSTAHLAGALGIPVWTLLPFAADFRWMRETARSPWYPSMRLYRQPTIGDWKSVLDAVAHELALKSRGRQRLNDVAFSGDGEPTTYRNIDEIVQAVADLKSSHQLDDVKLVLITNASMFHREPVVRALDVFDRNNGEIWAKLDAGSEEYYHLVERTKIPFRQVLDNITSAAKVRPLVIQSLFMRINGEPPSEAEIDAFCDRLNEVIDAGGRISLVQVYTVARQPAESFVTPLANESVDRIAATVADRVGVATEVYYGA
eukprot:g21894.t1